MKCDEARPLLDAYLDDELPAAGRAALHDHIEGCVECGPEAGALERLRNDIRRSAPVYRAPGFLRSLLADHLTDVASSDKHTVKPWFAGRTDVAPPGVDLAAQGFPLVGGRLDLIQGKPVPALVYRAGKHVINLFVLPAQPNALGETASRRGYTLRHWSKGDLGYWAVSDASPDEFSKFERAFRAAAGG